MYVLNNRFRNEKTPSSRPFVDAQAHGEDRTNDMNTYGLRRLHFCHGRILSTDRRVIPLLEKREGKRELPHLCCLRSFFG